MPPFSEYLRFIVTLGAALNIATRILGLLLAAMAVQTMAEGLKDLFPALAR